MNDSALEARADREGLMAARGESVAFPFGGASAALSSSSAASAAGPMQAKSGKKAREEKRRNKTVDKMFRLSAAKYRQGREYDMDLKNKKNEIYQIKYNELINKGYDHNKAYEEAKDIAFDEAHDAIKKDNYRYLSDKEEEWLDNMFQNPALDIEQEVVRRRGQLGEKLYQQRLNLDAERPGEKKGKLDLETHYSPDGTNYSVYDMMMNNFNFNDAVKDKLDETNKINNTEEQLDRQYKSNKLMNESDDDAVNKYLDTNEGKELRTELYKQQNVRLGQLSRKKKRLKRRKK